LLESAVPAPLSRSAFALRFMLTCAGFFACVYAAGWSCMAALPPRLFPGVRFPPLFVASTLVLGWGGVLLSRAIGFVRREKQVEFRRCLIRALLAGGVFCALQMAALNWLMQRQPVAEVQVSDQALVTVAAAVHALHFVLASMLLIFVTLKALAGRYDHEYFWDVRLCAWFWHALGIVWIVVLAVIVIATSVAPTSSGVRRETARRESSPDHADGLRAVHLLGLEWEPWGRLKNG